MKNKDWKKIKKKMKKLEKALRRYDWEPGENRDKFHLNDFGEVDRVFLLMMKVRWAMIRDRHMGSWEPGENRDKY